MEKCVTWIFSSFTNVCEFEYLDKITSFVEVFLKRQPPLKKDRKILPKKVKELRSQVLTFSNHGYRGWHFVHKFGGVLVFSARRLAFELHIMLIHLEEQFPDL